MGNEKEIIADTNKDFSVGFDTDFRFANAYYVGQMIKLAQISEIFLKKVKGNRILDLGCGWANFIRFYGLKYRGPGFKNPIYLGIDNNKTYIKKNKQWLDTLGNGKFAKSVSFAKCDLEGQNLWDKLGNRKGYDMVLACEIIEHVDNREALLKKCYDVLDDKGVLVISTPVHRKPNEGIFRINHIFHEFEYYEKDFYKAIEEHFVVHSSFGTLIETHEFKKDLRINHPQLFKLYNHLRKNLFFPPALLVAEFKILVSSLSGQIENLTLVCTRKK